MTEIPGRTSGSRTVARRNERDRRHEPRPGESFAQHYNRTREAGSRVLQEANAARGIRTPAPAPAASEPPSMPLTETVTRNEVARRSWQGRELRPQTRREEDRRTSSRAVAAQINDPFYQASLQPRRVDWSQPNVDQGIRSAADVSSEGGPLVVRDSIDVAARATNVPRIYLDALVGQEGGNSDAAENERSSATGATQFIDGTWLQVMHDYGGQYGLPQDVISQIRQRRDGSWTADEGVRERLLNLRYNGDWSRLMAAHYAQQEQAVMEERAGRPVTIEETYLSHFMNGDVAGQWVRSLDMGRGNVNARTELQRIYRSNPQQARLIIEQNPGVFSAHATVRSVYDRQVRDFRQHGVRNVLEREQRAARRAGRTYDRVTRKREIEEEFRRPFVAPTRGRSGDRR